MDLLVERSSPFAVKGDMRDRINFTTFDLSVKLFGVS